MKTAVLIAVVATVVEPATAFLTRKCGGTGTSTATCRDRGPANAPWHDIDGPQYDCKWYKEENECESADEIEYVNFGLSASEACCGCGGGSPIVPVTTTPTPPTPPTTTPTPPTPPTTTPTPPSPPTTPPVCVDRTRAGGIDWHGDGGERFNCQWYGAVANRCGKFGDRFRNFGFTANEACCDCGGGATAGSIGRRDDTNDGPLGVPVDAPAGVWSLDKSQNEVAHNTAFLTGGRTKPKAELVLRRDQVFTVNGPSADFALQSLYEGYLGAFDLESTEAAGVNTITLPVSLPIGRFYLLADGKSLGTIVVLFNPWSENDIVFLDDESERDEYIKNPTTKYYYGNVYGYPNSLAVGAGTWQMNQATILDDVLDLLAFSLDDWEICGDDRTTMDFADPVKVSRAMTYMGASSADHGVVWGRWDGEYEDGKGPGFWSGTEQMLTQWKTNGQKPVKYGQCWVFACTLTSFLRTLGIPSRVVSNFNSAHDVPQGFIDTAYGSEPNYDWVIDEDTADSVWNFHVWVNAWMKRPDLDAKNIGIVPHLAGWNDVDSTPQEESDGKYQMGPANHNDMLNNYAKGNMYDNRFVMGEYNAYHSERGSEYIGRYTMTKVVGESSRCPSTLSIRRTYSQHLTDCTNEISKNTKPAEPSNPPAVGDTLGARRRSLAYLNDEEVFNAHDYHLYVVDPTVGEDIVIEIDSHHADFNMKNVIVDLKLISVAYTGKPLGEVLELKGRKSLTADKMVVRIPFAKYSHALVHTMDFNVKAVIRYTKVDGVTPARESMRFSIETPPPVVTVTDSNLVTVTWTNPMRKAVKDVRIIVNGPSGTVSEVDVQSIDAGEAYTTASTVACGTDGNKIVVVTLTTDSVAFDHLQESAVLNC